MSAHSSRRVMDQVVAKTASDGWDNYIAVYLYSNFENSLLKCHILQNR